MTGTHRTITVDFRVANVESVEAAIGGFTRKLDAAQARVNRFRTFGARGVGETTNASGLAASSAVARMAMRDQQRLLAFRERESVRLENKLSTIRERAAQKQIAQEERWRVQAERRVAAQARREARATDRQRAATARRVSGYVRSGLNAPLGLARGAGRMTAGIIAGGLALGGSASIYDGLRSGLDAERRAVALENATDGAVTKGQLMIGSASIARETGIGQSEAISGIASFVAKTGDAETAIKNWQVFAKIARATDSEIGDIADAAADLSAKFDIKAPKEMEAAFAGLVKQGKEGAFELKDMAAQFPRIGAAARNFGWSGVKGLAQLGGLAQIARQSTPGSEEASTSVEQFFNQLQAKNDKLERGKFGFKFSIYNKAGDQRSGVKDLDQLVPELIDKAGGNTGKLLKVLDVRGMRSIASLNAIYNDTIGSTQGTDREKRAAAVAAVRAEIGKRVDNSAAPGMLTTDYNRAQGSTGANVDKAMEDLRVEFGQRLLPVLQQAIPKFRELIPAIVSLTEEFVHAAPAIIDVVSKLGTLGLSVASWAAHNPLEALFALISAGIIKAVAVNAISSAVGSLVANVGTASISLAGLGGSLAIILPGLAALGIGLALANKGLDEQRRNVETESDVKLGDYTRKYLEQNGDTPEARKTLETIKSEVTSGMSPEQYSPETAKFVREYVKGSVIDQTQSLFGMDPLDEVDREKIAKVIDGTTLARDAFKPKQPKREQLTASEAMSLGFRPEELGIQPELPQAPQVPEPSAYQIQPQATESQTMTSETSDALARLAEIAPILKQAADDQRAAARYARDALQQPRTFR